MTIPKHIVAVAGLVTDAHGRALMVLSPQREWELSGGQAEEGEDLLTTLERELSEETGVSVSIGPLVGIYSDVKSRLVMLDFLCQPFEVGLESSPERLPIASAERSEILARIVRPAIRDRLRDLLGSGARVVYRAYASDAKEPSQPSVRPHSSGARAAP